MIGAWHSGTRGSCARAAGRFVGFVSRSARLPPATRVARGLSYGRKVFGNFVLPGAEVELTRFAGGAREKAIQVCADLRVAAVNLDVAFEIGAVFDDDPSRDEVPGHRAVFLDLDAVPRPEVAVHLAVDNDFARHDLFRSLGGAAYRQPVPPERDWPFNCAVDIEVFIAGDFAFNFQARG